MKIRFKTPYQLMKKTLYLSILLAIATKASAQSPSSTQNYVMETTVKVPYKTTLESLVGLPVGQANRTIQYFDGLGRPLQKVNWQGSPSGKDQVQVFQYDTLGREARRYLPYAEQSASDGAYKSLGISRQGLFYQPGGGWDGNAVKTPNPYSVTVFEPSLLNRVERQGFPGAVWQPGNLSTEHTVRLGYGANNNDTNYGTTGFAVRLFRADVVATPKHEHERTLSSSGFYDAAQLYLAISKDENWQASDGKKGTVEEYRDKQGRLVLRRMFNEKAGNIEVLSTYYVYDGFGNLSFVLPPGASPDTGVPNATLLEQFCYQYRYDRKKRPIEKKLPGRGWEYMVYNRLDQLVLSQDSLQRQAREWLATKYDAHGRTIMTGIYSNGSARMTMQTAVHTHTVLWEERDNTNSNGLGTGYTNLAFPTNNIIYYHTLNYYDDYNFYGNDFGQPNGTSQVVPPGTQGLLTGARTTVLGTGNMLLSVSYYDGYGRPVQVKNQHNLNNGHDIIDIVYNFDGSVKKSTRTHINGNTTTTIATTYTYDHMGRERVSSQSINGVAATVLSELEYNELGQLTTKKLAGGLQSTSYSYNERGWLKDSNSPQFSMGLQYHDGVFPQYNGNISGQSYINGSANAFTYQYDRLNRLINGTATGMSEILSYDVMGNINTLKRDGSGHNEYSYNGNRLHAVDNIAYAYSYDANGNVTIDGRNGMALTYNHLDLPVTASKNGLNMAYTYDAMGKKLRKVSTGTSTVITDYVDGIQYTNGTIDFIQVGEGIARNNGGIYNYEYYLKDHLGNVRSSFDIYGGTVRILQRDDYYAFGLRKSGLNGNGAVSLENRYLYNGKELQDELSQYDYGARFYDPVIGRFSTIDPLSEVSRRSSPYSYALNNPIRFIDVDGMYAGETGSYRSGDGEFNDVLAYFGIGANHSSRGEKDNDDDKKKKVVEGRLTVNKPGAIIRKTQDGYSVSQVQEGEEGGLLSDAMEFGFGFTPTGFIIDFSNLVEGKDRKGEKLSWGWRIFGMLPMVSEFKNGKKLFKAAKGEKELFNFGTTAAKHMAEKGRAVPVQILEQAIKGSKGVADPQGSRALMHSIEMFRNGKAYKLDVLYDKATNSIWHFQYSPIKP